MATLAKRDPRLRHVFLVVSGQISASGSDIDSVNPRFSGVESIRWLRFFLNPPFDREDSGDARSILGLKVGRRRFTLLSTTDALDFGGGGYVSSCPN